MIQFCEKDSFAFGDSTYVPIYMLKDGVEYFVRNHVVDFRDFAWRDYEIKKSKREIAEIKEFLLRTEGRYFKFNGGFDDPFEMLQYMTVNHHTFIHPDDLFIDRLDESGRYFDFHGNQNEVSAAFHYRIYDREMIEKLKKAVVELSPNSKNKRGEFYMTREDFESICSARDAFCGFCQGEECDKCIVTTLVDDAYNELPEEDKADFEGLN